MEKNLLVLIFLWSGISVVLFFTSFYFALGLTPSNKKSTCNDPLRLKPSPHRDTLDEQLEVTQEQPHYNNLTYQRPKKSESHIINRTVLPSAIKTSPVTP